MKWRPSPNDNINGTDGKMAHLLLNHTIGIMKIREGKENLWQRLCNQILDIVSEEVGCLIDAGAILAGKSL